ncbi:MAG: ABC transporter substrate-binding protein [Burkholderiales bacterium]|nr:ABC transporter substrate-binding protein [Burkholderiales bacterium]
MKGFLFTLLACLTLAFGGTSYAVDLTSSPDVIIEKATNDVLKEIRTNPQLKKGDPKGLNQLVDNFIMPYCDFPRMTRMAVGPGWKSATPEQKKELLELFRQLLIVVYSGAVKEAGAYTVSLGNNKVNPDEKIVLIRTILKAPGKDPIQFDWRFLKDNHGQWKVFDVSISGVWMVENYRSQFASVITNKGINGLINSLKERIADNNK